MYTVMTVCDVDGCVQCPHDKSRTKSIDNIAFHLRFMRGFCIFCAGLVLKIFPHVVGNSILTAISCTHLLNAVVGLFWHVRDTKQPS